jgi:protein involved in polysaccharide export with SLBB domain
MKNVSGNLIAMAMTMVLAVSLTACATAPRIQDGAALEGGSLYPTLADNPRPPLTPYVIAVGDELAIKFYTNPELNEDVVVRPDGMISLQLVDDILAAGRTPKDLDAELTKKYTGELADPQISVILKKPLGHRMYVDGQVGKPGEVLVVGDKTHSQALQQAGGMLETAHRKQVILIRRGADGKPYGRVVDVRPIQSGANPAVDVPVQPLDIVYVPRSKIAEVDLFVKQYIRDALPIQALPIPAF